MGSIRTRNIARALALIATLAFLAAPVPGKAWAQSATCGCMDVVLVVDDTGSMGPAIDNVKAGLGAIITSALTASGGDLRMGLVTFKDSLEVDQPLTTDITAVTTAVNALVATGGDGEPEASDEAILYVATGAASAGTVISAPLGPLGSFRTGCVKIAVLVTDATPGGNDDTYVDGVDDVNAANAALAAAAAGIKISAVLVDDGVITSPAHPAGVEPDVMAAYASTTGGVSTTVPGDGTGTGTAIEAIIAACGSGGECPLSQGYWKTHPADWPVDTLMLGTVSYTADQLLALLGMPVRGDASLILAKQLIAAKLNIAMGSDPGPVSATIATADALLNGKPLPQGVKPSSATGKSMTEAAWILDDYNNRALTPECR